MNFRDLEYVIAVSQSLNFSKAAEQCHVSQPSLSTQIKKLEDQLGAAIFIRNKKKIHITAFGAEFIQKAEEILKIKADMNHLARANNNPVSGHIRLGGILTVAPYIFPQIAQSLNSEQSQIDISFLEGKTESLLKQLLDGTLDAAVISLPTDTSVFQVFPLIHDPFYVALGQSHRLSTNENITLLDLQNESFLLLDEGHCFRDQALDICQNSAAKVNKAFNATSLETIRHFVAVGEAVTFMPKMAIRNNDGICYKEIKPNQFYRDIALVWPKTSNKHMLIENVAHKVQSIID